MSILELALDIATKAHDGQIRWNGDPYISHPVAVAEFLPDWDGKIVALLHDVVEDTEITLDYLSTYFDPRHIFAIDAITKQENEDYWEYLDRVKANELARRVKIVDITYNLISLISDYPNKTKKIEKYKQALQFLI